MLNEYESYKINGYINILTHSLPNGRYVHLVKQKLTILHLCFELKIPLKPEHEERIKQVIRKLYQ